MIADDLARWRQYLDAPGWREAFQYLETLSPASPDVERVELLGSRVYARVMSYETRHPADAVLEAHDRFVDIQMTISGVEVIDCFIRQKLRVKEAYDSARDVVFFHHPENETAAVRIVNLPQRFAVLFPQDAHMPQLCATQPAWVKKVVIKVSTEFIPER